LPAEIRTEYINNIQRTQCRLAAKAKYNTQ